jgi:DNA-binding NtrC family response regulator
MYQSILIVEDELVVAGDIRLTLERAGYNVYGVARSYARAMEALDTMTPGLVLLDIYLKGEQTGIDLAVELNRRNIPFIYLSANCNQQVLEMAKVTQPYGFIVKPFREKDLLVTLDIARYRHAYKSELLEQEREAQVASPAFKRGHAADDGRLPEALPGFHGIIGNSAVMERLFDQVSRVAPMDTSVLIMGESGTGKEGVANCMHYLSPRRNAPFIKVNCGALPVNLVESELFGHEKGSFTGATDRRIGKFEQADGGTIFLDEIGEMQTDVQVKLLRVLQEREIERIGGKTTLKINVRVIAATNRNLEKEVAAGRFRLDLYYRLHVFPIIVPSLRERLDDVPLLARYFANMYAARAGRSFEAIGPAALQQLMSYQWPGNVRELQNLIERSVLMSNGPVLKEIVLHTMAQPGTMGNANKDDEPVKTIAEMEKDYILSVLKICNNRISGPGGAAELLNLPPSTLNSRMKKLGIARTFKA